MRTPIPLPPQLQHEPFDTTTAKRLGVPAHRLRASDVHHPFHGVHSRAVPTSVRELCDAFRLRMPEGAVFSHQTAATLLGVPLPASIETDRLHAAVRFPRSPPRARGVVGHSLGRLEQRMVEGLPVCSPAQVWCQLAGVLGREDLVAAGDHLVGARRREPLAAVDELAAESARATRTRGASDRAWALPRIRFGADSRPETLLRLQLASWGWEDLEVNPPLRVAGGRRILHPDLACSRRRMVFEYEGDGHRVERWQWHHDIERRELFEDAGWRVVRVTAPDLFHDSSTLEQRLSRCAPAAGRSAA